MASSIFSRTIYPNDVEFEQVPLSLRHLTIQRGAERIAYSAAGRDMPLCLDHMAIL